MVKRFLCTNCHEGVKIEGPTQGDREVPVNITCPHCSHPNELDWPIGAAYSVTPDDGT
jgi:RNase P subunit RPR2